MGGVNRQNEFHLSGKTYYQQGNTYIEKSNQETKKISKSIFDAQLAKANQQKKQSKAQTNSKSLAQGFYDIADKNSGKDSLEKLRDYLKTNVTSKNIIDFWNAYQDSKVRKKDSSMIDTLISEVSMWPGTDKVREEALNYIIETLAQAANSAGVVKGSVNTYKKQFKDAMAKKDTAKMESAVKGLISATLGEQQSKIDNGLTKDQKIQQKRQDAQDFAKENKTVVSGNVGDDNSKAAKIADQVYSIVDEYHGSTSWEKINELFKNNLTPENVVDMVVHYNEGGKRREDNNIVDSILSEYELFGKSEKPIEDKQKQTLVPKGPQYEAIYNITKNLKKAALNAGVPQRFIDEAWHKCFHDLYLKHNPERVTYDTTTGPVTSTISKVKLSETEILNRYINDLIKLIEGGQTAGAQGAFDDARNADNWVGQGMDTVLGVFGCKTIGEMRLKLNNYGLDAQTLANHAADAMDETKSQSERAAAMEKFTKQYEKTFHVPYDAKIMRTRADVQAKVANVNLYKAVNPVFTNALKQNTVEGIKAELQKCKTNIGKSEDGKNTYLFEYIEAMVNAADPKTDEETLKAWKNAITSFQKAVKEKRDKALEGTDEHTLNMNLDSLNTAAYGDEDIGKEVAKFNANQAATQAWSEMGLDILATAATFYIPGLGEAAGAKLAATCTKLAAKSTKMAGTFTRLGKIANGFSKGMSTVAKVQRGTAFENKVASTAAKIVANVASTTAGVTLAHGLYNINVEGAERWDKNLEAGWEFGKFAGAAGVANAIAGKMAVSTNIVLRALAKVTEPAVLFTYANGATVASVVEQRQKEDPNYKLTAKDAWDIVTSNEALMNDVILAAMMLITHTLGKGNGKADKNNANTNEANIKRFNDLIDNSNDMSKVRGELSNNPEFDRLPQAEKNKLIGKINAREAAIEAENSYFETASDEQIFNRFSQMIDSSTDMSQVRGKLSNNPYFDRLPQAEKNKLIGKINAREADIEIINKFNQMIDSSNDMSKVKGELSNNPEFDRLPQAEKNKLVGKIYAREAAIEAENSYFETASDEQIFNRFSQMIDSSTDMSQVRGKLSNNPYFDRLPQAEKNKLIGKINAKEASIEASQSQGARVSDEAAPEPEKVSDKKGTERVSESGKADGAASTDKAGKPKPKTDSEIRKSLPQRLRAQWDTFLNKIANLKDINFASSLRAQISKVFKGFTDAIQSLWKKLSDQVAKLRKAFTKENKSTETPQPETETKQSLFRQQTDGNNPIQKLNNENFKQVKSEIQAELDEITSLDDPKLADIKKRISKYGDGSNKHVPSNEGLSARDQRRAFERLVENKEFELKVQNATEAELDVMQKEVNKLNDAEVKQTRQQVIDNRKAELKGNAEPVEEVLKPDEAKVDKTPVEEVKNNEAEFKENAEPVEEVKIDEAKPEQEVVEVVEEAPAEPTFGERVDAIKGKDDPQIQALQEEIDKLPDGVEKTSRQNALDSKKHALGITDEAPAEVPESNKVKVTIGDDGKVSEVVLDDKGKVKVEHTEDGGEIDYQRGTDDKVNLILDKKNGQTTRFQYDENGNITQIDDKPVIKEADGDGYRYTDGTEVDKAVSDRGTELYDRTKQQVKPVTDEINKDKPAESSDAEKETGKPDNAEPTQDKDKPADIDDKGKPVSEPEGKSESSEDEVPAVDDTAPNVDKPKKKGIFDRFKRKKADKKASTETDKKADKKENTDKQENTENNTEIKGKTWKEARQEARPNAIRAMGPATGAGIVVKGDETREQQNDAQNPYQPVNPAAPSGQTAIPVAPVAPQDGTDEVSKPEAPEAPVAPTDDSGVEPAPAPVEPEESAAAADEPAPVAGTVPEGGKVAPAKLNDDELQKEYEELSDKKGSLTPEEQARLDEITKEMKKRGLLVDDESVANKTKKQPLTQSEIFSITKACQEANDEATITDLLRTLRKVGVFKGRKNLRRLLKNKYRVLIENKTKYQSRIDKYDNKAENKKARTDQNFLIKDAKKHPEKYEIKRKLDSEG